MMGRSCGAGGLPREVTIGHLDHWIQGSGIDGIGQALCGCGLIPLVGGRCLSHVARYASSARSPVKNAQKKHPTDLRAFTSRRIVASTSALVGIALPRVALDTPHVRDSLSKSMPILVQTIRPDIY